MRFCTALLVLIFYPLLAAAQATEQPAPAVPEPADIERVIDTLEDPEARAELVTELRVLLEAEGGGAAAAEEPLPDAGDVVDVLWGMVRDVWESVRSIEPRRLLTSLGLTAVIVIVALVARWLILRLLRAVYARLIGGGGASAEDVKETAALAAPDGAPPADEHGPFPPPITRLINLIVAVLAAALIAESWGAEVSALLDTDIGARIVESGLAIGLILLITTVAWHVAGLIVARLLTIAAGAERDRERSVRRLGTLVPLLRSVLQGVIGVLSALLILSELGVDIAPLLAGAGILGLAVGFGAQTLVKDLIGGVSILLEDSATVGDVVEVAGHGGVVEEMRVRLIRLRDLAGAVHFIPYSEVTSIINFTKDFAFYVIELRLAYREDTDQVCAVLDDLTEELRQDPVQGPRILEPLELLGVDKFTEDAVIVKARIRTRPGDQWSVGRELNRRMKRTFDRLGIEIPFPHTTVWFGEPKEGTAPPARLAIVQSVPEGAG